jgi:serine/threonine protein kinase
MTAPAPNQRFGPYELFARIGAGGMGEVWKARDARLDRVVALKVLKTEFSDRFEREGAHPLFGPLITGNGDSYDVSADGQRILAIAQRVNASEPITICSELDGGTEEVVRALAPMFIVEK